MFRRSISSDSQEESLLLSLSSASAYKKSSTSTGNISSLIHQRSPSSNAIHLIPELDVEDNHGDDERSIEENRNSDTKIHNNNNNNNNINNIMTSSIKNLWSTVSGYMNSTRLMVLLVLCLQNSLFTVLRRYSQGVLQENYSKHELLLVAELIKILYSSWMISKNLAAEEKDGSNGGSRVLSPSLSSSSLSLSASSSSLSSSKSSSLSRQLMYLVSTSRKMFVLALIYGAMNILSFISLRNISAGMFTIFAQCKILTTATFSTIMLKRQYSWTKWRALIALMLGVLLFSEPIWGNSNKNDNSAKYGNAFIGTVAVLIEVTLSGFASIYFEKVIKTDTLQLGIWERNFQLALGSFPVYIVFIIADGGSTAGFFGGWSWLTCLLSALGAAGGLLVALSIKYGDSILKTLATTGAIVLTGILDHVFLGGPLTPTMVIAGVQVIIAICNYTFDATSITGSSTSISSISSPTMTTTTTTTTIISDANNNATSASSSSSSSSSLLKSSPMSSIPSGDGTSSGGGGVDDQQSLLFATNETTNNNNDSNKETEMLLVRR